MMSASIDTYVHDNRTYADLIALEYQEYHTRVVSEENTTYVAV